MNDKHTKVCLFIFIKSLEFTYWIVQLKDIDINYCLLSKFLLAVETKSDNTFISCRRSPNKWMCFITKPTRDCVLLKVSFLLHYTIAMSCYSLYIIYYHFIYAKAYTCYMHAYTHTHLGYMKTEDP